MAKYDYPELIKRGTVVGPVTKEMRRMCKEHIRSANRYIGKPEEDGMECWPDFIPLVRKELKRADKDE